MKTTVPLALLICLLLCVSSSPVEADENSFKDAVLSLLGDPEQVPPEVAGQTLYGASSIRDMYELSGFQPLWDAGNIGPLASALEGMAGDGLVPADYRFTQIQSSLGSTERTSDDPGRAAEQDILLSEAFLRAIYHLYYGKADPESLDPDINFARSQPEIEPIDLFIEYIRAGNIEAAFDWARPESQHYQDLKAGLSRYRRYQAAGGWSTIPAGDTLKPDESDPRLVLVRERLRVTGDLVSSGASDSMHFDNELRRAVEAFQVRHGLEADGLIGPATLAEMNLSVHARVDQIRVNLERERWILHEAHDEYLVADIAGFEVYWAEGEEIVWREQAQVGREYTKTPVFGGEITYLEFNPTWTIPPGILRKSVIPGLKKDPGYLDERGYHLLSRDGKRIDPHTVDWANLKGFPYIVRQPAGPDNALGQVKFIFPNPHFVFLHDTNHRDFFDQTKRTFSSGCIRVRNPFDLAERLLSSQGWDRTRIDELVESGKTKRVTLDEPMRVFVVYNTARVPHAQGQVHFRPDVYQRDAPVLAELESPFRLHLQGR